MKKIGLYLLLIISMIGFVSASTNNAYDFNILYGELVSGTLNNTFVKDGNLLVIGELNTEPSLIVDFFFSDGDPNRIFLTARYRGGQDHFMIIQVYDFETETFVNKAFIPDSVEFLDYEIIIDSDNIQDEEVILRFEHSSGAHPNHFLDIDYLSVEFVDEVIDEKINFFDLDLTDTLTIILIVLFLIGGLIIGLLVDSMIGGVLFCLIGLIILFGGMILFGLILIIIGVTLIFFDKPLMRM